MAASKLYPTLSKFYEDKHIDFGSELDNIRSVVPGDKLYRKVCKPDLENNNVSAKNNGRKSQPGKYSNKLKNDTPPLYPRLSENISNDVISGREGPREQDQSINHPVVPSAPPVELLDEDLLRFLEDAIREQSLSSPLDETPAVDYSSFTIPSDIILDDTWVDDLLPDYDVTFENTETDLINNLNKTDVKISRNKSLNLEGNIDHSRDLNISPDGKRSDSTHKKDIRKYHKVHKNGETKVVKTSPGTGQSQTKKDPAREKENRVIMAEAIRPARPLPGSPEYSAWMTWRKQLTAPPIYDVCGEGTSQKRECWGYCSWGKSEYLHMPLKVNRQLATVILLRHGGQVKLQKRDMSRKHLNQRSIDFVSKVVKSENKTSLGGKPFVMYGIPRASLSGS